MDSTTLRHSRKVARLSHRLGPNSCSPVPQTASRAQASGLQGFKCEQFPPTPIGAPRTTLQEPMTTPVATCILESTPSPPPCTIYSRKSDSTGLLLSQEHKSLHIRNLVQLSLIIFIPLRATLSPARCLLPLMDSTPPGLASSDLSPSAGWDNFPSRETACSEVAPLSQPRPHDLCHS